MKFTVQCPLPLPDKCLKLEQIIELTEKVIETKLNTFYKLH